MAPTEFTAGETVGRIYEFILGASFMFSLMIAWLFMRNRKDVLSRIVVALMIVVAAGYLKDAFFPGGHPLSVVVDIVAIPLYACILYELCDPGRLTLRKVFILEIPFIILPVLLALTGAPVFYYLDLGLGLALGLTGFFWTCLAIPRYNRRLKSAFSYNDDIDLKWLQSILWSFFVLLTLWGVSCIYYNPWLEITYMCCSLVMWCFICFFVYKHKSVVDELKQPDPKAPVSLAEPPNELFDRIRRLITEEKLYLNPQLKLSDISRLAHTNRTYASAFFNSENTRFYDYINGLRIQYAKTLLTGTAKRIEDIAVESGFSSRQSFHRVFLSFVKVSPTDYRESRQRVESKAN